MKIIEDKQNMLLKRREIKAIVEAEKNPTMQEAAKTVAEHFKTAEENTAIKQVKGKFGRHTFLIVANIYKSKEDKEKIEPKTKKKEKEGEKAGAEKTGEQQKEEKEKAKENKEEN